MKNPILILSMLFLVLSSCKVHFTESTRLRIESSKDLTINQVQFYNDAPIRLVYKSSSMNDKINRGKVEFKNGYYYYHIRIPKHTKAVAKVDQAHLMQIFFEEGDDTFLTFKNDKNQNGELYQLNASETDSGLYVSYGGKSMKIVEGEGAFLEIKKSLKNVHEKKKRKLKGVKI